MPRLDKELNGGASDAEPATHRVTRHKAQRAGRSDGTGQPAVADNQDAVMNYEACGQPYRMSLQVRAEDQLNGLEPQYSRDQRTMHRPVSRRFQDEMNMAQAWQDERYEVESPVYRRTLANASSRTPEEDREQENTDSSRDPSTDNGESSGNSQEAQQWSDTEGTNRPLSTETNDESQREIPCRVSWCEHAGKRYGLCWAHGGVKKCCHRNCPKIALDTSEFCSIHEREVSASTF
ncbi:hypothetical protein V7S43_013607 [Phytophthora oleae]|uniref:C3H1-type domain-containing protein n=1 Tax=Phytophthora oleae TaxID=2107226 RepID=A0ABD3F7D1_9STRA